MKPVRAGTSAALLLVLAMIAPIPYRTNPALQRISAPVNWPHADAIPNEDESPAPLPVVARLGTPLALHEEPLPPGALVRFGSTRFRHPKALTEGTLIAERYLATAHEGTLTLTDLSTGRRVWAQELRLGGEVAKWLQFLVSPDGKTLAIWDQFRIGSTQQLLLWQIDARACPPIAESAEIAVLNELTSSQIAFSPDSKDLFVWGHAGLCIVDPAAMRIRKWIATKASVVCVSKSGNRYLTTPDFDPRWLPTHFSGLESFPEYRFQEGRPTSSPDRRTTYSKRDDIEPLELFVWDVATRRLAASIRAPRETGAEAEHLHLSPDGMYVSLGYGEKVVVWQVSTGRRVLTVTPPTSGDELPTAIVEVEFSSTNNHLLVRLSDGSEQLFDLVSGRLVQQKWVLNRQSDRGWVVPEMAESANIVMGTIRAPGTPKGRNHLPGGYAGVLFNVSRDGKLIVIGDWNGIVDLWSIDGNHLSRLSHKGPRILSLAFNAEGSRIAASDQGRAVRIWSTETGRELQRFDVPVNQKDLFPSQLTFSPDGKRILINSFDVMTMWDLTLRKFVWDRPSNLMFLYPFEQTLISFSMDGKRIAFSSNGRIQVLDAATGKEASEPALTQTWNRIASAVLSPDWRVGAKWVPHAGITAFDGATGKALRVFAGSVSESSTYSALRFSPDGRHLAACDRSGRAHIWEVSSGERIHVINYKDGAIQDLRFGSDGQTLITSNHREVIVWSLRPKNLPMPPRPN